MKNDDINRMGAHDALAYKPASDEHYKQQEKLAKRILSGEEKNPTGIEGMFSSEDYKEPKKQKYYVVIAEPKTIPMAMFTQQSWAEEWQFKYCHTAIIEEFDLVLVGGKP